MLVLSLFPGFGLLDHAFELEGFTVVRGPDLLWGGDVRRFTPPADVFDGIIGGPPCQPHSNAREIISTTAVDLIPEFTRCVEAARPRRFVVMENVNGVHGHDSIPRTWHAAMLRDWDCGGLTTRRRSFWTWPMMIMDPPERPGDPSLSVLASTAKRGGSKYASDKSFLAGNLPLEEYERLQGAEGRAAGLMAAGSSKYFAVHCLGNGVPVSMGRYVARAVRSALEV